MSLKQTISFLRPWMRTPALYKHTATSTFSSLRQRSPIFIRSYVKQVPKRTQKVPYYQQPRETGVEWVGKLEQWALRHLRRLTWKGALIFVAHTINFALAAHLFTTHILGVSHMMGPSMLPTFENSWDMILEDKITYTLFPEKLARGDVILLDSPLQRGHKICKRVMGLPGDIVCVDPTGRYSPSDEHVIIPKGHIWIVGDNASMSRDSRTYGPVPMALIKARVLARIWPPQRIALFPGHEMVTKLS